MKYFYSFPIRIFLAEVSYTMTAPYSKEYKPFGVYAIKSSPSSYGYVYLLN